MKKTILICLPFVFLSYVMLPNVSADVIFSDAGVKYSSEIKDKFNQTEKVYVYIELNNNSEEDIFLSNLSNDEFKFIKKHSYLIVGEINEDVFDKLVNDNRIKEIYPNNYYYTFFDGHSLEYDSSIIKKFEEENQTWVWVIVSLKDDSNIVLDGTQEERKNLSRQKSIWFEGKIEEIINSLFDEEFEPTGSNDRGFSGKITREGFDKLINDSRIKDVYLNTEVQATDSGVPSPISKEEITEDTERNESEQLEETTKFSLFKSISYFFNKMLSFIGIR